MAGSRPEFRDFEGALAECEDEASCRNAFKEYSKRGGSNLDAAAAAVRRRIAQLPTAQETITAKPGGVDGNLHGDEQRAPPGANGLILPAVTGEQAKAADNAYLALVKAVEGPGDTVDIKGKPFRTKQFWRKMARHYQLADEITHEETLINNQTGQLLGFKLRVTVTAPNGRKAVGVGMCSIREKKDATDHNLYALAHTRAKNRAIADLVAAGEPSAEEFE